MDGGDFDLLPEIEIERTRAQAGSYSREPKASGRKRTASLAAHQFFFVLFCDPLSLGQTFLRFTLIARTA